MVGRSAGESEGRARGLAQRSARDDRRRRRTRFRRRRVLRAAGRRLAAARRDRRREPLRARRLAARPRGARARDVGVLPRPRRADAARGAIEWPVLAESTRRPAVLGLRDAGVAQRRGDALALLRRRDAFRGASDLHRGREPAGCGAAARPARRAQAGAAALERRLRSVRELCANSAARSTSICPRRRSSSTSAARFAASRPSSGS